MQQPRIALAATLALMFAPTAWGQPQAELVLHFVEIGQGQITKVPHVLRIKLIIVGWRSK